MRYNFFHLFRFSKKKNYPALSQCLSIFFNLPPFFQSLNLKEVKTEWTMATFVPMRVKKKSQQREVLVKYLKWVLVSKMLGVTTKRRKWRSETRKTWPENKNGVAGNLTLCCERESWRKRVVLGGWPVFFLTRCNWQMANCDCVGAERVNRRVNGSRKYQLSETGVWH